MGSIFLHSVHAMRPKNNNWGSNNQWAATLFLQKNEDTFVVKNAIKLSLQMISLF